MTNKPHLNNEKLKSVRDNADWKRLFEALGLKRDEKKSTPDDWWAVSPFSNEKEPSFHINDKGFYCFSTKESGGVIELVQAIMKTRGQIIDCYDAGRWLLEQGISSIPDFPEKNGRSEGKIEKVKELQEKVDSIKPENKPIKQDLRYALVCDHSEFDKRGISAKTMKQLGAGFMPADKTKTRGLQDRFVFQVRGVQRTEKGELSEVIYTHVGRASTKEQAQGEFGKWWIYPGFRKSLELYNIDNLLLDPEAVKQIRKTKRIILVEGAFDVAKLVEAGILNCVSTFGSHLYKEQLERIRLIQEEMKGEDIEYLVFYDRDKAGQEGTEQAVKLLKEEGIPAKAFDWDVSFSSKAREVIKIPGDIKDVCEFSVEQLIFLMNRGAI